MSEDRFYVVQRGDRFLLCQRRDYEQNGRTSQVVAEFYSEGTAWTVCQVLNNAELVIYS